MIVDRATNLPCARAPNGPALVPKARSEKQRLTAGGKRETNND
jgi:hypothetical protein